MVNIIKQGEASNHFAVKFKLDPMDKDQFTKLKGEALGEWMENNGYQEVAQELSYRQVFVATLSDFLQFVFTALKSSEKGHLAVTYSLLRKPFKDNLFILESLLHDRETFHRKFESENSYCDLAIEKHKPDEKKKIIESVLSKLPLGVFDSNFIYNIRYSKKETYSLEHLWQKATHIVTSCANYRTEPGNLNFIFSSEENKEDQWDYLYSILPTILLYTCQICFTLYFGTIAEDKNVKEELWNRIFIGYFISSRENAIENGRKPLGEEINELSLICQKCGNEIRFTEKVEKKILEGYKFRC